MNPVEEQIEDAELIGEGSDEGLVNEDDLSEVEKRYNERVQELVSKGFSPRKAKRYLESISRRSVKKFMKKRKKRK